ncbi:MAG: class I SAM-dependent methyltransferase [Burkholderiales bacterium]|nr:class I SAM-dependent methyltransferase [Burkholderiales bacterium]
MQEPASPPEDTANRAAPAGSLENWFQSAAGRYVLAWERQCLEATITDLFGYFALQVGLPGIDLLAASRMPWRFRCGPDGAGQLLAHADELPIASESVDLVLLPHLLEESGDPHQTLREAERVLRPDGVLVVTGFNPLSLWGARRLAGRSEAPPWNAEFVGVLRLKDWLKLLNFEVRGGRYGCYRPPFDSERWLTRFGFLEKAGSRWWPVAGAAYVLVARKRVAGMRVITPSRRPVRAPARLLAPTASQAVERCGPPAPRHALFVDD